MPLEIAAEVHRNGKSSSGAELKKFLDGAIARLEAENDAPDAEEDDTTMKDEEFVSLAFCRTVCEMLLKAEDAQLVIMFFKEFCSELGGAITNDTVLQLIIQLVRKFEWSEISEAVLNVLGGDSENVVRSIEMALRVAVGVDCGAAHDALAQMAVDKAEKMEFKDLFSSMFIGLLWKEAIRCSTTPFLAIASKLESAEPSLLEPSIQYFIQYLNDNDKKSAVLTSIVGKRIEWLKTQIEQLDKPFSWEMRRGVVSKARNFVLDVQREV